MDQWEIWKKASSDHPPTTACIYLSIRGMLNVVSLSDNFLCLSNEISFNESNYYKFSNTNVEPTEQELIKIFEHKVYEFKKS